MQKWRQKTSKIDAKTSQQPSKISSQAPPERLPKGCRKQARKANLWDYRIGSPNRPHEPPEGIQNLQNFVHFFTSFLHVFNGLLAPNMALKTSQNLSKIDVHVQVFLGALLTSDFHRKFVRKWIKPKSAEGIFAWELMQFVHFRHVQHHLKIRHDLHPNIVHVASQNHPKINAKTDPRGYRNLRRISKRFWKVLRCEDDVMLNPCWRPRCHKIQPKSMSEMGSQKGSKNVEQKKTTVVKLHGTNQQCYKL